MYVFSLDLFNFFSEAILREAQVLPGLIIGGHYLINISYANDTESMADTERKQEILQNLVKKIENNELIIRQNAC